MCMSTIKQPSRFRKFLSGKGFYVALAVCLLVIAGVAFATFSDSIGILKKDDTKKGDHEVVDPVSDVPDTRTTLPTTAAPTTAAPTTATPTVAPATDPLFVLPGSNEIVKAFSGNTPVYSRTMGDWRCHNGADFAGNSGMTVKAVADGTVKKVETDPAFGEVIVIDHGSGVQSRYCGVTPTVKVGAKVSAAGPIGTLAGVPCESADGCHLHLEITVKGAYADPVKTIDKQVKYRTAE